MGWCRPFEDRIIELQRMSEQSFRLLDEQLAPYHTDLRNLNLKKQKAGKSGGFSQEKTGDSVGDQITKKSSSYAPGIIFTSKMEIEQP